MLLLTLFIGFLFGALAVVAAEVTVFLIAVARLHNRRRDAEQREEQREARDLDGEQSLAALYNKKGAVWVLEPEKIRKGVPNESPTRLTREQKKKDIVEVFPVKKYAKIKDHLLILIDMDGSQVTIGMLDCTVVAVSASDLPSRKWAKRYPIKLESKKSEIYSGSKICYIYLDTSWEKESWCKALRLASCPDNRRLEWYYQMTEEFRRYLASLNSEYPAFLKPAALLVDAFEKTNKIDSSSSRVRLFLKKIAKKSMKSGYEYKANPASSFAHGERHNNIRSVSLNDASLTNGLVKASLDKNSSNFVQDLVQPTSLSSIQTGNKCHIPVLPDMISEEKFTSDEGTLCWNLLFSRLFFDAKRSIEVNNFVKGRIQRALSSMRTPSYIGGVTCTGLDLGNLPPYIHSMKVLPVDLAEVLAVEVDIEYSGGILLDVETRLEVCAPELQKGIIDGSFEPSSSGEAASDLLEGIEHYGNQLKLSGTSTDPMKSKEDVDKNDGLKQSKSASWKSTYVSRWKAIMHSIADQVSQVPLSLAIKISSLRGTLRLHIKPPPADQLWCGFTSMPEIAWNLESAVGDRKITTSHIAVLIGNRVKTAIREALVLPNCECICIPWMLAEKDDWVPRKAAPFIWVNQETVDMTEQEVSTSQSEGTKTKPGGRTKGGHATSSEDEAEKVKNVTHIQGRNDESHSDAASTTSGSSGHPSHGDTFDDLRVPLLKDDETLENNQRALGSSEPASAITVTLEEERSADLKTKKIGSRRARMIDLGKKMGEKFEEKRRHIEEKSRHIVEKMRENTRA